MIASIAGFITACSSVQCWATGARCVLFPSIGTWNGAVSKPCLANVSFEIRAEDSTAGKATPSAAVRS
ncbi:hypothetical protein AB0F52_16585 [Amycolatopsis sp. NPDC024027]|uniref:hypothetical protein n=1 Tax=Amycolatopsis sp. NPDC024027 TaxID=3154327 RepID=UPI0033C0F007